MVRGPFKEKLTEIMYLKQLSDPEIISKLVLRLVEWYNAWAPIPEYVLIQPAGFNDSTLRCSLMPISCMANN